MSNFAVSIQPGAPTICSFGRNSEALPYAIRMRLRRFMFVATKRPPGSARWLPTPPGDRLGVTVADRNDTRSGGAGVCWRPRTADPLRAVRSTTTNTD